MPSLKINDKWVSLICMMPDEDVGRIFKRLVQIRATKALPSNYDEQTEAVQKLMQETLQASLRQETAAEAHRNAGQGGGRPVGRKNKAKPEPVQEPVQEPTKPIIQMPVIDKTFQPFMDENEATEIMRKRSEVMDAARYSGFDLSPSEMDSINDLCAEHGDDQVMDALKACANNGVKTVAYLRGVLNGRRSENNAQRSSKPRSTSSTASGGGKFIGLFAETHV